MTGGRGTAGRRLARSVLAVVGFGGAAVFSHYWLGDSWSAVMWLAASLALVWIGVEEAWDARGRRRAGQRGE